MPWKTFSNIFKNNAWHGSESKSGTGSDLKNTEIMRPQLVELVNSLNIENFIDAPCGDFNWMKTVIPNLKIKAYLGVDIVEEVILLNQQHENFIGTPEIYFLNLDITKDILPKADLIFSRDCLVHFSFETIRTILKNFKKSNSKYLLTTTFTSTTRPLVDINDGEWRAVNFTKEPLFLPEPITIINEGCIEGNKLFTDKSLGLWDLTKLEI